MSGKKIKSAGNGILRRIYRVLIYISLIVAFIYGKYFKEAGFEDKFIADFPEYSQLKKVNEFQYKVFSDNEIVDLLFVGSDQGYGGPLTTGIQLDSDLNIQKVHILEERETYGYLQKVIRKGFFEQFIGKNITDDFQVDSGVDAVTTCTVSSVAFAQAIKLAAVEACKKADLKYSIPEKKWQIGKNEILSVLVIIIGIAAFYLKKKWMRYISLAAGFIIVGFIVNSSVSIANFGRLFLGYFPDPRDHFVWWLLMLFFIGFSFLLLFSNIFK